MEPPLVPPEEGRVKFGWAKTAWLYSLLGCSALIVVFPPSVPAIGVSMVLLVVTLCAGHSVGLHRGIIHGAYRCSPWLRGLLAYAFVHTGIGGPVSWIELHYVRDYYQNRALCPRYFGYRHGLLVDYFWNLHLRFVPQDRARYGAPRVIDPWLLFLERTWALHVIGLGVVVAFVWGPATAIATVPLRVLVSVLGHWFVGFAAHKRGYVRYELDGSAEIGRNLLLLGAMSFGEGFHNNHHANPSSARMGQTWYELDLGWLLLRVLRRLRLVWDVQAMGESEVRRSNARKIAPAWRGATRA